MFINLNENIQLSHLNLTWMCVHVYGHFIHTVKKNILSSALSRRESAASSYAVQLRYEIKMHRSSQPWNKLNHKMKWLRQEERDPSD